MHHLGVLRVCLGELARSLFVESFRHCLSLQKILIKILLHKSLLSSSWRIRENRRRTTRGNSKSVAAPLYGASSLTTERFMENPILIRVMNRREGIECETWRQFTEVFGTERAGLAWVRCVLQRPRRSVNNWFILVILFYYSATRKKSSRKTLFVWLSSIKGATLTQSSRVLLVVGNCRITAETDSSFRKQDVLTRSLWHLSPFEYVRESNKRFHWAQKLFRVTFFSWLILKLRKTLTRKRDGASRRLRRVEAHKKPLNFKENCSKCLRNTFLWTQRRKRVPPYHFWGDGLTRRTDSVRKLLSFFREIIFPVAVDVELFPFSPTITSSTTPEEEIGWVATRESSSLPSLEWQFFLTTDSSLRSRSHSTHRSLFVCRIETLFCSFSEGKRETEN